MNQKLLTILLRKNVDDLKIITDSFIESGEISAAIIHLAQRKTEDIQLIISQLSPQEKAVGLAVPVETSQENVKEHISEKPVENQKGIVETPKENNELQTVEFQTVSFRIDEEEKEEIEEKEDYEEEEDNEEDDEEDLEPENEEEEIVIEIEEKTEEVPVIEEVEIVKTEETVKAEEKSPIFTLADKMGQTLTPSRHEALYKSDNSLGNTLGNKKVDDIKQAISIGDRFRFQRELFANNGEDMNRILNYINQLATFDEAVDFLKAKYKWKNDNETANDFLNVVKRKF